jgi:hypothetical protein
MVFWNLRSGLKAELLFHSKHASRRNARARFRAESRQRVRVGVGIAGDIWRKALRNGYVRWRKTTLFPGRCVDSQLNGCTSDQAARESLV